MLELYHHGSSVCAAKVRLVLYEKGLDWKGHYLDILKGDQFDPEYVKLNPKAVVPTLVHDGKVLTESTLICEYLDEVFPDPPLKPADPYARWQMRLWTKAVDDQVHPACAELTFSCTHRHTLARLPPEELERFLEATPAQSVKPGWKARKREIVTLGFDAPGIGVPFKLYDGYHAEDGRRACRPAVAHRRDLLARRHRHGALRQPARHAGHGGDVGEAPAARRLVRAAQGAAEFPAGLPAMVPQALADDFATFGARSWPDVKRILAA